MRMSTGSQHFRDWFEKYLIREFFVKSLRNYTINDVNLELIKSVRHGERQQRYKTSACVLKRNAMKRRKFEGSFKTKETKRVGRYASNISLLGAFLFT
jgi:hypothetical protein